MELEEAVGQAGIQLINDIRANLGSTGTNATQETSRSLRIQQAREGSKIKMQLLGRPFFMTVQTGRRPTPDKKPSKDMIDNITKWVNARSIDIEAVWAIATNIQKKGTKLWQSGGREDIVDPAIDDFINNVSQAVLKAKVTEFVVKIKEWYPS